MASHHPIASKIAQALDTELQALPAVDRMDTALEAYQRVWGIVRREGLLLAGLLSKPAEAPAAAAAEPSPAPSETGSDLLDGPAK